METPPPPTRVARARNAHAARHFPFSGGDQKNGDGGHSRGGTGGAGGNSSNGQDADSVNMAEEFAHRFVQNANIFLQQQQHKARGADDEEEEEPIDFSYARPEDLLESKDSDEQVVLPALPSQQDRSRAGLNSSSPSFASSLPPPSFLGKLVNLRLSCNRLTGPLPQSLSLLCRCEEICLDGNRFTGPILPNHLVVGLGGHLRHLELGSNRLTGTLIVGVWGGMG